LEGARLCAHVLHALPDVFVGLPSVPNGQEDAGCEDAEVAVKEECGPEVTLEFFGD
jgi:hypothetical protein